MLFDITRGAKVVPFPGPDRVPGSTPQAPSAPATKAIFPGVQIDGAITAPRQLHPDIQRGLDLMNGFYDYLAYFEETTGRSPAGLYPQQMDDILREHLAKRGETK